MLEDETLFVIHNTYEVNIKNSKPKYFTVGVYDHLIKYKQKVEDDEDIYTCECHPLSENRKALTNLFIEFQKSYRKEGAISEYRAHSLLSLIIAESLDLADGHRKKYYEKGKRRDSFYKLSVYIKEHIRQPFSPADIAEELGYTVQYLNSLTHAFRNKSLKEFVNFHRLEVSREKLLLTATAVQELALDCGFKSSTYYIKVFKSIYGITPLQLKMQLRQKENSLKKELHSVPSFQELKPKKKMPKIEMDLPKKVTLLIVNSSLRPVLFSWQSTSDTEVEMYRLKSRAKKTSWYRLERMLDCSRIIRRVNSLLLHPGLKLSDYNFEVIRKNRVNYSNFLNLHSLFSLHLQ